MAFYFENSTAANFNNIFFKNQLLKNYKLAVFQFKKITQTLIIFKLSFFLVFLFEFIISIYLMVNFSKSFVLAIVISFCVLTIFAYFVILFYLNTKKPEQLFELKQSFIKSCRHAVSVPRGIAEHHLSIANALMKLSYYLYGIEYSYFNDMKLFKNFFESLSIYFYFEDVFTMQEMLLLDAIDEHIIQIKNTPTDLELHVSLAHAYVSLAKLYMEIKSRTRPKKFLKKYMKNADRKIEMASSQAIDEFTILKEFAPNDPWIHAQLAQCFHSLKMYDLEAKEYENILELSPDDLEIKFRLGQIYFSLGRNSEGLQIYKELLATDYKGAEILLNSYSALRTLQELENIN